MNTLPRLWVILERRNDFPNATWCNSRCVYSSLDRAEHNDVIGRLAQIEYSIQECAVSLPSDSAIVSYPSLTFFALVHQHRGYPPGWRVFSPTFNSERAACENIPHTARLTMYTVQVVKCIARLPGVES